MVTVPSGIQTQVCLVPKPSSSHCVNQGKKEGGLAHSASHQAPNGRGGVAGNWNNIIGCFPRNIPSRPKEYGPKQPMLVLS